MLLATQTETMSPETFAIYFSCFSGHMVEYKGVLYTTAEHAYHSQRYEDPIIVEEIKGARSAYLAWKISQKYKAQQIEGFDENKLSVMEQIFRAKLDQHEDVKRALVESGDSIILKNHQLDYFWGTGADGTGRNEMGKLWMKLRE